MYSSRTYSCPHCLKCYTRKISLDRHSIVCELLQKSRREVQCDSEENTDIPTVKQLYMIVQELASKNMILERKIDEMSRWVDRKKSKINAIHWLNDNMIPRMYFAEWIESIIIKTYDVQVLLENNIETTILHLFKNIGEKGQNPLAGFSHKTNNLYVYINGDDKWQKIENKELSHWLKQIHHQILIAFNGWYSENKDTIHHNDSQHTIYNKALTSLISADLNETCTVLQKVKRDLFNLFKIDIKGIVEYEI
jgi:hypothetical protein